MQHEPRPATGENMGDVLASIRRLIAQDQAERPGGAMAPAEPPAPRSGPFTGPPLILARSNLAAEPEGSPWANPAQAAAPHDLTDTPLPEPALSPEDEAEIAEAEAVLARMLARPPSTASQQPVTEAAPLPSPVPNVFAEDSPENGETALRALIRDILHEELRGETGQRVSRQLHRMVRHEVEAVIRDLCAEE